MWPAPFAHAVNDFPHQKFAPPVNPPHFFACCFSIPPRTFGSVLFASLNEIQTLSFNVHRIGERDEGTQDTGRKGERTVGD